MKLNKDAFKEKQTRDLTICRHQNCKNTKAIISQWGHTSHHCLKHLEELFNK